MKRCQQQGQLLFALNAVLHPDVTIQTHPKNQLPKTTDPQFGAAQFKCQSLAFNVFYMITVEHVETLPMNFLKLRGDHKCERPFVVYDGSLNLLKNCSLKSCSTAQTGELF